MMFTEGLDESAVNWIKQGSQVDQEQQLRSPFTERSSLDHVLPSSSSLYTNSNSNNHLLSPKLLPPLKFYSGLLGFCLNDEDDDDDYESVASVPDYIDHVQSDSFEDEGLGSTDTDLFEHTSASYYDEELFGNKLDGQNASCIRRGCSKENLQVQVPVNAIQFNDGDFSIKGPSKDDIMSKISLADLGTPSAPPILQPGTEENKFEECHKLGIGSSDKGGTEQTSNVIHAAIETQSQRSNGLHAGGQNAWQTMVAYDACIRLCLNAWARGCTEAPEFLQDECLVLQSAFGLHNFLLQPRRIHRREGIPVVIEESCTVKAKKVVGQIRVEVKKIRIIPRRKLKITHSQRGSFYLQVGTEYVRHVSALVKNGINSLKPTPFSVTSEETMSCLFQMKSSIEAIDVEPSSAICLHPRTGDYHVLCLPSYDITVVAAVILLLFMFHLSAQVVETLAYDLVLESAMRAQHFNVRNLRLHGPWKWLLNEFADYYGVSDSYTKLRYLSYVMTVATPTSDCLETVYELLVPVVKAKSERSVTRQEKSILLDCETQVENLLAKVFENYKSLDELSPTGLTDLFGPIPEAAAPALGPAVQVYTLIHDILAPEAQNILRNYLRTAATKRCRRHMVETDEFMSSNTDSSLTDPMTISTAYLKMKNLCIDISAEIQADIKIHNQHILPSSIDLSNIAAAVYSTELCKRLKDFLATWPPSSPLPHVTDLLIAAADLERDLEFWNISNYHSLQVPWSGVTTNHSTSPFAEDMYDKLKDTLHEYEVVIKRWPQYSLLLENAITNVEGATLKALEKQYSEILTPLKDSIPKKLGLTVQKLTRRQSVALYSIPTQLGIFLNTIKRILDVLHCRVEDILKPWASCLPVIEERKLVFGEQLNGITVLLRKKYKNYMQAIVEKLTQGNRSTRLKRILEETKVADGEVEIRERMKVLSLQLMDSISNVHGAFSSRIFIAICRGFWDRLGQMVLKFLENRKENRVWYNGSYYALGILDDTFASQMQKLQGNALQEKDVHPPRSVVEARSILCRDNTQNAADPSTDFYL
ncbi:hypothetical protein IFM89_029562 [Coptis chinensis]|uniref:Pesticidal crystal cry8Ba protein n=1 Tax=Coptis chinensis TaxID=261450 RepID=A0A835LJT9_9MAGN|nr:hypothetical protein IFM89_029562 [Coptis chinensis]